MEYELKEVEELYALGDRVRFKGICFIIAEASSYLSSNTGMLLHNYLLVTKGASCQERIYNPAMKGKSISGSVLDVSKGYTKLHLAIDQSQDSSQGEWFVQPSFYTGSGGYCAMPERGMSFPCISRRRMKGIVISSVPRAHPVNPFTIKSAVRLRIPKPAAREVV